MQTQTDELTLVFGALADPTRRDILTRLRGGTLTAGDLAKNYAMSRSAISQHLTVLDRAGLIDRTVNAQWRECSVRVTGLDDAAKWVAAHRATWTEHLDNLEEHLANRRKAK